MEKLATLIPKTPEEIVAAGQSMTRGITSTQSTSDCPLCSGVGMVNGANGMKRCECEKKRIRAEFFARIPAEFGVPRLEGIRPDATRHPRQADAIAGIRQNPEDSYFIFGANGTGKTFLGWAICVNSFEVGRKVVVADLDRLLKDWRKYQFGFGGPEEERDLSWRPPLLAEDLQQGGRKYTIFLDEISATSPTEYAAKEFFHLLKAAHEFGHQVITTCNVNPQALQAHWSRQDIFWGDSIARRLAEYSTQVNLMR